MMACFMGYLGSKNVSDYNERLEISTISRFLGDVGHQNPEIAYSEKSEVDIVHFWCEFGFLANFSELSSRFDEPTFPVVLDFSHISDTYRLSCGIPQLSSYF